MQFSYDPGWRLPWCLVDGFGASVDNLHQNICGCFTNRLHFQSNVWVAHISLLAYKTQVVGKPSECLQLSERLFRGRGVWEATRRGWTATSWGGWLHEGWWMKRFLLQFWGCPWLWTGHFNPINSMIYTEITAGNIRRFQLLGRIWFGIPSFQRCDWGVALPEVRVVSLSSGFSDDSSAALHFICITGFSCFFGFFHMFVNNVHVPYFQMFSCICQLLSIDLYMNPGRPGRPVCNKILGKKTSDPFLFVWEQTH